MSLDVSGHGDPTPITAVLLLGLVADAAEVGFGQNVLAFISASVFQWIWMTWGLGECDGLQQDTLVLRSSSQFSSRRHFGMSLPICSTGGRHGGGVADLSKAPSFVVVNHDDPLAPKHHNLEVQRDRQIGIRTKALPMGGGERDDDKCAVAQAYCISIPSNPFVLWPASFLSAGAMEEERGFLLSVLWYVVTYNGSVSLCTGGQRNREEKAERRPARWTGSEVATEATRSPIEEGGPDVAVPSPPPPPLRPPDRPARRPRTPSGFGAGLAQDLPHDAHVLVLARPHLLPQLLQPCSWEAAERQKPGWMDDEAAHGAWVRDLTGPLDGEPARATRACQVALSARVDAPVDGGRHWTSFEFCTLSVCVRAQANRYPLAVRFEHPNGHYANLVGHPSPPRLRSLVIDPRGPDQDPRGWQPDRHVFIPMPASSSPRGTCIKSPYNELSEIPNPYPNPSTEEVGRFSHTAEATEEAASPRFSALRNLAKAPSAVRLRVRCDLAAIFAGVSPEENDGFAIEDASHSQASSSTATLGAPSQPRSILPLLPDRGNISSRPLAATAVDSTVADHIHSRRSTPPVILGIRGLQPQQHSRCFPQTTGSLFYRQNRVSFSLFSR
ncbi:hypothetical protein BHE74_00026149 [Ensete ventricosum]|nr:hypothetical protein BHE74_00026149 [Ensete ventricosum]